MTSNHKAEHPPIHCAEAEDDEVVGYSPTHCAEPEDDEVVISHSAQFRRVLLHDVPFCSVWFCSVPFVLFCSGQYY